MISLGHFEEYTPAVEPHLLKVLGVIHFKNETDQDWYGVNSLGGTVVGVDASWAVCARTSDATSLAPAGMTVLLLEDGDEVPSIGDIWDGVSGFSTPQQDAASEYEAAIQSALDSAAAERRYSNGATMATYVNSTNATWAAEAQAFVQWRDAVWLYAYALLDAVMAGESKQPTVEELLAELPTANWPA